MALLLKGGKVFTEGKLVKKDLLIEDGKIVKIGAADSDEVIDVSDKIILPGLIDPHVHMREPGLEHKEDFFTGSMSAAAGGVTTFLDMPNTIPPTFTVADLEKKRQLAKKSVVNYGFHFGSNGKNIDEIKKAENIASVKVYLDATTGNLMIEDPETIEKIFSAAKTVAVHADGEMVERSIELAKKKDIKLYLCHISSVREIGYIKQNKNKNLFAEVTPHHLFLTDEDKNDFTRVKPVLKTIHDVEALWDAIDDGLINTIGTDHAPHTIDEKEDSEKPSSGVPGLETMLPLLLNKVNERKIKLAKVIELCCENPAKIFGIKNKGKIKKGYDADLTVVDMELEKEVVNDKLFTKCKWSPFVGMKLKGWPVMTIVNGEVVFDDGKVNSDIKGKEVEFSYS